MIKLVDILKEINDDQINISDLNNLDDEIKKAIEDSPKNEIIGTVSLVLALPGLINAITKIIGFIAKKAGIQLKKSDPKWYQVIEKVTKEIDDYIDSPIKLVLKPFITDQTKREKIAKILKAVTLTMMAIYGAVDISKITPTINSIKQLTPELAQELIQIIIEQNPTKIASILKPIFT